MEQVSSQRVQDDVDSFSVGRSKNASQKGSISRVEDVFSFDAKSFDEKLFLFIGAHGRKNLPMSISKATSSFALHSRTVPLHP